VLTLKYRKYFRGRPGKETSQKIGAKETMINRPYNKAGKCKKKRHLERKTATQAYGKAVHTFVENHILSTGFSVSYVKSGRDEIVLKLKKKLINSCAV
jgi:hypothetical protein